MIPFKSTSTIRIISQEAVAITTSSRRRIIFGVVALLLLITTIVGFDGDTDFSGSRLTGTIFIFLLLAGAIGSAGYDRIMLFDKHKGNLTLQRKFLIFPVSPIQQLANLSEISTISFLQIQLMRSGKTRQNQGKEYDLTGKTVENARKNGLFGSRANLYQLSVETAEKKIMLQESTYPDELENTAQILSQFLGIRIHKSLTH